jgi:hypothetical protein
MASPKPSSTAPNTRLQGEPPTARTHHPSPKPAPHLIPHVHISSHRGCEVEAAARRLSVAASTKIKENPALCCCSLRTSVCSHWAPHVQGGSWSCSKYIIIVFPLVVALPLVLSPTPVAQRCQRRCSGLLNCTVFARSPRSPCTTCGPSMLSDIVIHVRRRNFI